MIGTITISSPLSPAIINPNVTSAGARLQYVEFFGKFFTGGGRAFDTFKPSEKYVDFEKENGGKKDD